VSSLRIRRAKRAMPEVIRESARLRQRLQEIRQGAGSIGLVPTMGALHAGHIALLQAARHQNDIVVASIFVNALQFDRQQDLDSYPRSMEADLKVCDDCGVDFVFAPEGAELYPAPQLTFVTSPSLSASLCGQFRPGHFRGVATVVLKLFNVVQPDRAYFGEKDAQQLAIVRRMVQDLNVPLTVVPVATIREPDGLAISSRNKLLTAEQREIAPVLSRALRGVVDHIRNGERSVPVLCEQALATFAPYPQARVEYFELVDPAVLAPVESVNGPVLVAGALWLGSVRLIDNISWPGTTG
jgi:pantoate--beta-alanine ligase